MSERYQASTGRNVRAAYRHFRSRDRMRRRMLQVADMLDHLNLRLRLARDWAVRKLR